MTPNEIAVQLARDPEFTGLSVEDQEKVFRTALSQLDIPQPEKQFGVAGSVPREAFERGERNVLGNIFERPGAAVRGAIQGLAPGGPSPGEGFLRGSQNPASVPRFQDLAIENYYRGVAERNPGVDPTAVQTMVGNIPSAVGLAADIATNPADVLVALATGGLSRSLDSTKAGQALSRFGTKPRHLRRPPIETVQDVLRVPNARLPRLTQQERSAHFRARSNQIRDQFKARSSALREEHVALGRELGKSAQKRSLEIREQLPQLYSKQSTHYRGLVDRELSSVAHERVTESELRAFLLKRFENDPERLVVVSSRLKLANAPEGPISTGVLDDLGRPIVKDAPPSTRKIGQIYQVILDFGQDLPRSVREGLRVYSPEDNITDDAISSLVDFLQTKKVDLREARTFWANWAPVRNQATREFRPFVQPKVQTRAGSQRLIRLAKGIDPDNTVYGNTLSELLGIDSLPGDVRGVVAKLVVNKKTRLGMVIQQQEATGALQAERFAIEQLAARERRPRALRTVLRWLAAGATAGAGARIGFGRNILSE